MDNSGSANCSGNLAEFQQKLRVRGSFHFAKKLFASNVGQFHQQRIYGPCQLTIPRSFVQAHGDKFRKSVVLRSGNKAWNVRISICPSRSPPEVTFCAGWRRFVYDNGLVLDDQLIFHLKAMSRFEVYVFNCHGEPKVLQSLGVSETETSEPKGSYQSLWKKTKRKKLTTEEYENLMYESYHGRSMRRADDPKTKLAVLPASFKKQFRYRPRRDCMLEIPVHFMKKYGKWLQRRLLVQGIFEYSPVRIISCAYVMSKGKYRFCLQDGWEEFWRNNKLQDGQELIFTLVSDSKFKVRAVPVNVS